MKTEGETGANTRPEGAEDELRVKEGRKYLAQLQKRWEYEARVEERGRIRLFTGFVTKRMQSHRLEQKPQGHVSKIIHSSCHVTDHHHLSSSPLPFTITITITMIQAESQTRSETSSSQFPTDQNTISFHRSRHSAAGIQNSSPSGVVDSFPQVQILTKSHVQLEGR